VQGKPFRDGPEYLANAAANIYNPAAGTYAIVSHIRLVNTTNTTRTASLYIGASGGSAGGTELLGGYAIPANDFLDLYFHLYLTSSDFLSGLASAASAVTIITSGELFVS